MVPLERDVFVSAMIHKPEQKIYKNPVPTLDFNPRRYHVGYCQRCRS